MTKYQAEGLQNQELDSDSGEWDEVQASREPVDPEGFAEGGGPGGYEADSAAEVDPVDVERLRSERDLFKDRHIRLLAEFDNYRKRTQRDLEQAREGGRANLAEQLLDVLDDFQRVERFLEEFPAANASEGPITLTIDDSDDIARVEQFLEGTIWVVRKLDKTLADIGVERIDPAGERFDPNVHEALTVVPTETADLDGFVSDVFRVGYSLSARLLRPAQVTVFAYTEPS